MRSKSVNKSYLGLFGFMMRRSESSEPHSTMYYLVGVTFSLLAYSTEIAVCSILFLAFCDPAATLFGRCLGHLGPRLSSSKSLVSLAVSSIFFPSPAHSDASAVRWVYVHRPVLPG